jgi:expansin (peptidoglycan-binding protein)
MQLREARSQVMEDAVEEEGSWVALPKNSYLGLNCKVTELLAIGQ